ncbi:hypothetical protein MOF08_21805, partial [Bacillus licheniformis]
MRHRDMDESGAPPVIDEIREHPARFQVSWLSAADLQAEAVDQAGEERHDRLVQIQMGHAIEGAFEYEQ